MKRFLCAAVMAVAAIPAFAADVGVAVSIGQPGFYGTLVIGNNFPRPQVIYARPIVVQPAPRAVVREPLYLRVPPGHMRHWSRHCYRYNACGRPVYFVRDDWYNNVYVPRYREYHRDYYDDRDNGRSDIGVSVSIGQPGFYGVIDIGDYPRPELIYSQPVIIQPAPVGVVLQPLYLHVPLGYERNWREYCGAYNACGRPVYFVRDDWYNNIYVPQYRQRHDRGDDRRENRDDDRQNDRHDGRGYDYGRDRN